MESCIEDLEEKRPEIWKAYLQAKEQLDYVETKIIEAKAELDKERMSKEEEIKTRGGWHF